MSKAAFKRMMRERSAARLPAEPPPAPSLYSPPTDEQLANFVAAMVNNAAEADGLSCRLTPWVAGLMLRADAAAKAGWIRRHREFQEAVENEFGSRQSAVE